MYVGVICDPHGKFIRTGRKWDGKNLSQRPEDMIKFSVLLK